MEKNQKILELRERLDKTLAMPDLINEESVKSLVKDQLMRSSLYGSEGVIGNVAERRTKEVSNFLEMLRSASGKNQKAYKAHEAKHKEWKIKQDTDQLRVMYREGPHGTPFHTLLTEGFADGPIDVCLCVSWESTLYKKWWPQYNIPTFKITMANCLQKVQVGEEISLVRVKVAWPVSEREALLHYFEIEYFKEDLVIVLLNTISDTEHIDVNTHGFSREGIPQAKDTVRIDLVGGFVLQKVDNNKSYFRAIANMDIKLDFVPPSLINFISRQLIGNGHKLYQKAVSSVAKSDEDYREALKGSLYIRIREGLDSCKKINTSSGEKKITALLHEEHREDNLPTTEIKPEIVEEETEESQGGSSTNLIVTEIIEEETEESLGGSLASPIITDELTIKEKDFISPEVEQALRKLDQAIAIFRGRESSDNYLHDCCLVDQKHPNFEPFAEAGPIRDGSAPEPSNDMDSKSSNEVVRSSPAGDFRNNDMDSAPSQAYAHQRENSSTEEGPLVLHEKMLAETASTVTYPPASESMRKVCDEETLRANGFNGRRGPYCGKPKSKQRKNKYMFCCIRG